MDGFRGGIWGSVHLSVFVRKSALQVHCTCSPWGQRSFGTWGSRPWISLFLCAKLHCRYTVSAPPGGRVYTGPEDQGPGPLRLCTQICTAGTVYPLLLGAEFIWDLRIKALDLSVFVRKSTCRYCVPTHPGGRVHIGPEDQGPGSLRFCV